MLVCATETTDVGADVQLAKAREYHLSVLAQRGSSRQTTRLYGSVEDRFIRFLAENMDLSVPTVAALTAPNVQRFADWLRDEAAASTRYGGGAGSRSDETIGQYVAILKYWSSFLVKDGWLSRDPLASVRYARRREKVVQAFSQAQVERMVALCASTRPAWRNRAICLLLYDTGLRVSELVSLRADQVALSKGHEPGRAKVLGKGAKERHVYFGGRTSQAIAKYLVLERERSETRERVLFVTADGRRLGRTAVLELVKDLGRKAGIEGMRVSPHVWRHSFAVEYLRRNPGQLEQLRRLLGHANLTQSIQYARIADADVAGSFVSLSDELGRRRSRDDD